MGATVFYESSSELATLTNTFSVSGTATDPTTISLTVTSPTGTSTTYTYADGQITKTSTGVYTKDIACPEDGIWQAVWTGTGTASDVTHVTWTVFGTAPKLYCTVEELKSRLGISATDTADDFELRMAVEAASRWLDDWCGRHFWRGSSTRTFVAEHLYELDVDDLISITSLATDDSGDGTFETTWATTDYQLCPVNASTAHAEARPYTHIKAVGSYTFPAVRRYSTAGAREDRVQIVGVWGWPAIPSGIKAAALIIAAETFKIKDTFSGAGGFGDMGMVVRRSPQALDYARPYRRHAVLVA